MTALRAEPNAAQRRTGDPLTIAHTTRFAALARANAGLNLKPEKIDFFTQRLTSRRNAAGCETWADYVRLLESGGGPDGLQTFVEALTTHTTHFFREPAHFDWLDQTGWQSLLDLGAGRDRPLTIWSAAASTGVELYSALISASEWAGRHGLNPRLAGMGTDISTQVLAVAENGIYDGETIKGIPKDLQPRYLLRARDGSDRFRIKPDLRRLCKWETINLTRKGTGGPSRSSLIFLRNVMIYFDKQTQKSVVEALLERLEPGGILLTGHSESLSFRPEGIKQEGPAIYRKIA